MPMKTALFDDHFESFPFWREAGLSGLTCVHVDAHLDVSTDGFSQKALDGIAQARNRDELLAFRGNPKLPWGGFHCGNYLYPALVDGTVTTLIWVVPSEPMDGTSMLGSARQTIQGWVDMTLEEYSGLQSVQGRVEGTLFGRRLVFCTAETMPSLTPPESEKLVLDIDVDYFVRLKDDQMWQSPHDLRQALGDLKPLALTVATSCEGGYTPLSQRYLGQVCLDVFSHDPELWKSEVEAYRQAFNAPPEAPTAPESPTPPPPTRQEQLQAFLEQAPEFMKPSVLCALQRYDDAAALHPDYRPSPLDQAGRHFQRRQYSEGLACLEGMEQNQESRRYLTAFMAAGNAQLEVTLDEVKALLEQPGLAERDRARLLSMQADVVGRKGHSRQALTLLREAVKVEPDRPVLHHQMAHYLRLLGERDEAAKHVRKALRLTKRKVSSLPILLDASRLYDELGQRALARATRRELEDSDVTGFYAINAILDSSR